ncbi:copper amine oxidase [Peziza echinospora]|nr:copper amine oxidase [Peziza echinospora]
MASSCADPPRPHYPFSPLTNKEIKLSAEILRATYPPTIDLHFKAITLHEPAKEDMIAWMAAGGEHSVTDSSVPRPPRRSYIPYYIRNTERFFEAVINLDTRSVESNIRLGEGVHGPADWAEIAVVEKVALEDEGVKRELEKLDFPKDMVVVCDAWIYGSDGIDDLRRQFQCFLYARPANEPDSCHYAFPLPISPVIDGETKTVTRIDLLPTGNDFTVPTEVKPWKPQTTNEYLPEYNKLRTDLKPLQVVQPKGASFTITSPDHSGTGKILEWQKWRFRIGFNSREGMVLYDVSYDNRSLFYRLALSDMNIPYGDPRAPYHKKAAFDLGDVGAGLCANNLTLGCDCLGSIHYLSGWLADDRGEPIDMKNCICIHEQDAGIGWKHTNYRTGRAALVRNRELVLQSIITVSNYEYILAWIFNQAGEVTYEVRATGILSTSPFDPDLPPEEAPDWGTIVHPGVLAAHHQHIFSLRIDPAIDGHKNSLIYEDTEVLPRDPVKNPHGVGYITKQTTVTESCGLNTHVERNRRFMIQNHSVRNPINHKPVGYKIVSTPFQKMLADHDSWHWRRAEFADKSVYVTKYRDGELYAAGKFTNQSRGGDGVRTYASRKDPVADEDIVVWVQFGLNHIPRIEDFPVMPVEILRVSLKPVNFFTANPAIDVPPSTQSFNRSTLLAGAPPSSTHTAQMTAPSMPKSNSSLTEKSMAATETTCCSVNTYDEDTERQQPKQSAKNHNQNHHQPPSSPTTTTDTTANSEKESVMHNEEAPTCGCRKKKSGFGKKAGECCHVS